MHLRKIVFPILSILSFTGLIAGGRNQGIDERLTELENQIKEVGVKNSAGTYGANFGGEKLTEHKWSVDLEVLTWKAQPGGLDWVIVFNQASYPLIGDMKSLSFKWNWGARVGLTRYIGADNWDLNAFYTGFTASHGAKVISNFDSLDVVTGTLATGSTQGNFKGKISLNQIDVNLGKTYFLSQRLSYHPYVGLMALFLNQRYQLITTNAINALSTSIPVAGSFNTNLLDQCKNFGIGPRVGLDMKWWLCSGFKINGGVSTALLQTYYKVEHNTQINSNPVGQTPLSTTELIQAPLHQLAPYCRVLLGIGYYKEFMEGKRKLDLGLNWESNYYFRVNQTLQTVTSTSASPSFNSSDPIRVHFSRYSEDLAYNGVTLQVNIGF